MLDNHTRNLLAHLACRCWNNVTRILPTLTDTLVPLLIVDHRPVSFSFDLGILTLDIVQAHVSKIPMPRELLFK